MVVMVVVVWWWWGGGILESRDGIEGEIDKKRTGERTRKYVQIRVCRRMRMEGAVCVSQSMSFKKIINGGYVDK